MPDRVSFPLDRASLGTLRVFVAVVEAENLSEVARQMRLSVSSVSKHVAALEESMETALLYRTTRKMSVTKAGREFYERCRAILAEVDKAVAARGSHNEAVLGHLRISAPPSVAAAILSPRISGFLKAHPGITLDFFVSSALPDIVRHRIDAAIVLREWPEVKMANIHLGSMERVLCASPEYIHEFGTPATPNDLVRHRCLMSLLSGSPDAWTFTENGVRRPIPIAPAMASDNGDCIMQACVDGAGIANLYAFHARTKLEAGLLVPVLPEAELDAVGLYVILPRKDLVNSATAAFLRFLEETVMEIKRTP